MSYFEANAPNFDFGWRSAPDSAGGAHSVPPGPLAGFKGSYFYGKGRERKGKRKGRGIKGRGLKPLPLQISGYATVSYKHRVASEQEVL